MARPHATSQPHLNGHAHAAVAASHSRRSTVSRASRLVAAHEVRRHSCPATPRHGVTCLTTTRFSACTMQAAGAPVDGRARPQLAVDAADVVVLQEGRNPAAHCVPAHLGVDVLEDKGRHHPDAAQPADLEAPLVQHRTEAREHLWHGAEHVRVAPRVEPLPAEPRDVFGHCLRCRLTLLQRVVREIEEALGLLAPLARREWRGRLAVVVSALWNVAAADGAGEAIHVRERERERRRGHKFGEKDADASAPRRLPSITGTYNEADTRHASADTRARERRHGRRHLHRYGRRPLDRPRLHALGALWLEIEGEGNEPTADLELGGGGPESGRPGAQQRRVWRQRHHLLLLPDHPRAGAPLLLVRHHQGHAGARGAPVERITLRLRLRLQLRLRLSQRLRLRLHLRLPRPLPGPLPRTLGRPVAWPAVRLAVGREQHVGRVRVERAAYVTTAAVRRKLAGGLVPLPPRRRRQHAH
eukprot:scaffold59617_cov79-Phaeocystis_antarctica.AAC.22